MVLVYRHSLTSALAHVYTYIIYFVIRYDHGIVNAFFSSDSQGGRRAPRTLYPTGAGRSQGGMSASVRRQDCNDRVIFDPTQNDVHEELRIEIGKRNLEAVLDPKMMELASLGGFSGQRTNLPWAGERLYVPSDLRGT